MALKVVQWTTGNVGRASVRAIADNPLLELVGGYAFSHEKVGRDVGELAGIGALGIPATNDVDALLALEPDCVSYNPLWPDVNELVRILEAGVNVCSTAAFMTGHALEDEGRARIEEACRAGHASMFGSGINPGFVNMLGLVLAGLSQKIERITVRESVDSTAYSSPETEGSTGFGQPIDNPELPTMTAKGTAVFGDAVRLMAEALALELDEVVCESEYAQATRDMDLGYMTIRKGCVSAIKASWLGRAGGVTRIDLQVLWRKGQHIEPDWQVEHGYLVEVEGLPGVKTRLELSFPPEVFAGASTMNEIMSIGMLMTALPAVNAIPAVCAAAPGIVTYRDLPLITGAGRVAV